MNNRYYIDNQGTKEEPVDLVTLMRRVRAQKIGPDTLIFVDDATTSSKASDIPDLRVFFSSADKANHTDQPHNTLFTLRSVLNDGWRFTIEHNIMTVFSGGIILMCILLLATLSDTLGFMGIIIAWIMFVAFHYFYLVFSLRLFRGQPISVNFINTQFAPVISILLLAAIIIGTMIAGGLVLLIVPALIVALYYVFVPLFIMDRGLNVIESMYASRLLVKKFNQQYQKTIALLILCYLGSVILIIPIPLTMPIFTAALIKMYEELSTS